jgi:hypothetical protein
MMGDLFDSIVSFLPNIIHALVFFAMGLNSGRLPVQSRNKAQA